MQFIVSLIDRAPLFSADVVTGDVAEAFAAYPATAGFAVTGPDGAVVGLIERTAIARAIGDGQGSRRVGELMIGPPLTLDAGCTAREAVERLSAHPTCPDTLVVTDGGAYAGVCSARALAQALASQSAPRDEAATEDFQRLFHAAESEFRGHVRGLLAMTDRLARQHLNDDAMAQVQSIRAASETLLRLADDAKDMMRARQGALALNLGLQPLRALMDQMQARWSPRAEAAGVGLLFSYDGDPDLAAMVDAGRLIQVFDNLIDNRHTHQGSIEASLRARIEGDHVALQGRVRDTGQDTGGAKLDQDLNGTGASLPLSLTQSILASMQGSIRAESNAGQGVTLLFDLTADLPRAAAGSTQAPSLGASPHVLVVDDNATNRMVAEALCEMFECTSETAEDGVEAVERVRGGRFDLILMDIKMPRMDGIAATREIRALAGRRPRRRLWPSPPTSIPKTPAATWPRACAAWSKNRSNPSGCCRRSIWPWRPSAPDRTAASPPPRARGRAPRLSSYGLMALGG